LANDEEEIAVLMGDNARARGGGLATIDPNNPRLHWWPSSLDFQAEADRTPPSIPVRDFRDLLNQISKRKGLDAVYWYGHGARGELQFGGGYRTTISEISVMANADVSGNFAKGGKIVFVACNTGQDPAFLQAIANALRVRVDGFLSGVEWWLDFLGSAPRRKITRRGLVSSARTLSSARPFLPNATP
jgi:hypothetical protein